MTSAEIPTDLLGNARNFQLDAAETVLGLKPSGTMGARSLQMHRK